MAKYLLTGSAGFVGNEVIRQLKAENADITAIVFRESCAEGVKFIKTDITRKDDLNSRLEGCDFDYILHVASLPGDTGDPYQMMDVNVNGCLNMLELARVKKVKKIVIASSISAYEWYPATKFNPPDYLPVDERHHCRPRDMYSTTKRMQELLALTYFTQYSVPASCLRLTAIIGPNGQGGGRGWRTFAEALSEGRKVQIPHFSFDEMCHYVDIRDVAAMLIFTAKSPASAGEIFNCCGPRAITGREFEAIIHKFYPEITVECGFPWSMAQGNQISFSMDKAKQVMAFEPKYDLEASIAYIKEWIDKGGLLESFSKDREFTKGVKNN